MRNAFSILVIAACGSVSQTAEPQLVVKASEERAVRVAATVTMSEITASWREQVERTAICRVKWSESTLYPKGTFNSVLALRKLEGLPEPPKGDYPPSDVRFETGAELTIDGNKSYLEASEMIWSSTSMAFVKYHSVSTHDGDTERHYSKPTDETQSMGVISRRKRNAGLYAVSWPYCLYLRGIDPHFFGNEDIDSFEIEEIGKSVVLLKLPRNETSGELRIALDRTNGFVPLWVETYTRSHSLSVKCKVIEYTLKAGMRVPFRWQCQHYFSRKLERQIDCELLEYASPFDTAKVNYALDYPVGTVVSDQRQPGDPSRYVVTPSGRTRDLQPSEFKSEVSRAKTPNVEPDEVSNKPAIFIAISMIALVASVLVYKAIKRLTVPPRTESDK